MGAEGIIHLGQYEEKLKLKTSKQNEFEDRNEISTRTQLSKR